MTLRYVISGGQRGADQAALYAAFDLGVRTGGYAPRGYRVDGGFEPDVLRDLFGLVEHPRLEYPPRTEANVASSSGTLIIGNPESPGCRLTRKLAIQHSRPLCILSWFTGEPWEHHVPSVQGFLASLGPAATLNVAGNRERMNPGISQAVYRIVFYALSGDLPRVIEYRTPHTPRPTFPRPIP